MADNISLTSFHTAHNGSSVHPQTAQGQVEVMGNPDEIWIRRKGSPGADCFNLSDLQSATPPVRLVTGFRRFLISQYPSLKEIDSYNIIIKKYGEVEAIPEESPVSVLAGNTKQTAHIVEVRPMDLEAAQLHSGQQKVGIFRWIARIVILLIAIGSFIASVIFIFSKNKPGTGIGFLGVGLTAAGIIYAKW